MRFSDLKIAIDGPASSGKSTVAKKLANLYHLVYVDTGAMYRALTYLALTKNVSVEDEESLLALLKDSRITFEKVEEGQLVYVNNQDVTEDIRKHPVTNNVSVVSAYSSIREEMVRRQQEMAKNIGVVMDGRDIGTVVLPNADVKIYLVASVNERAERRYLENTEKGIETDFDTLKREIIARDAYDTNREVSPLKQAKDAVLLDTSNLSIEEVVHECSQIIENKVKKNKFTGNSL